MHKLNVRELVMFKGPESKEALDYAKSIKGENAWMENRKSFIHYVWLIMQWPSKSEATLFATKYVARRRGGYWHAAA